MEASKEMIAVSFGMVLVCSFWVVWLYTVNPFLRTGFITLDDSIAMYVDTLSSVESGSAKISGLDAVSNVRVAYEESGDKDGYEIEDDGWYVIVSYKVQNTVMKSASMISAYPPDAGLVSNIYSPESICVEKEPQSEYAVVSKC